MIDLDVNTEFISPDRMAMLKLTDGETQLDLLQDLSPFNDSSMDVDVDGAWTERQGTGADAANPFDTQAPARHLDDSLSRTIRQHRNRTAPFRKRTFDHRRGDLYPPHRPVNCDRDNSRADRGWIPLHQREDSPETLEEKARAILVADMADADFKEEREDRREDRRDDRRDRGNYRGNNKRRRDGEYTCILSQTIAQAAYAVWTTC
ncbi:cap binding protein [Alternaria alternata]|nr:cap binding protein [Alternaria alternata]